MEDFLADSDTFLSLLQKSQFQILEPPLSLSRSDFLLRAALISSRD
jgi:hypothetical protein